MKKLKGIKLKQNNKVRVMIRNSLIVMLALMTVFMFQGINYLQGTARIINYAGVVRGGTQRLVKLEMQGKENEELLNKIDAILYGLQNGSEQYQLVKLKDEKFQEDLKKVEKSWIALKKEIDKVRKQGVEQSNILEMSEEHFRLADCMVSDAEYYIQKLAHNIQIIQFFTIFSIIGVCFVLINESIKRAQLSRYNSELSKKAYLDLHTGLMNKSRCNELFADQTPIFDNTACIMLDLNNLKQVNDTFGHMAGDTLIINFATVLKKTIPKGNFIGRYGGDEFVIVLYHTEEEKVQSLLEELKENVEHFNSLGGKMKLSFAYGYDGSWNYEGCILKMLLDQADHNMYLNKQKCKCELLDVQAEEKQFA